MKKGRRYLLWVFLLIALIPLLDFLGTGLPITHDGQDHVARVANFSQSLSEGNLIPRWAANLNWGFGHPILMFLYPLPSYIASFFHLLGFSLIDSTKIVFALGFVLSGVFMYRWIRELWGEEAGFVSGLFYMFAPYRFVNLYVRGAIGENLAFVWPPLICWFLLRLSKNIRWRYLVGGALSLAALILSHNALSLMFLPFILGYAAFLAYSLPTKRRLFIVNFFLMVLLGMMLSAFFWFPAFFEGKYTLRDIVTSGDYATRFRPLRDLIYSPWSYGGSGELSVQVGPLHWLAFLSAFYSFFSFLKKKDKNWLLVGGLTVGFVVTLFLLLKVSLPLWQLITLLQKFQFPWRFLSLLIFIPAVLVGSFLSFWPKRKKFWLVLAVAVLLLLLNKNYWQAKGFSYKEDFFYRDVYAGTTDTGESSPHWSVRFMERYPQASLEVIEGTAEVEELDRSTTKHVYQVKAETEARLVENTLYFPGWDVLVDGQLVGVEFQDPRYRGLMTFNLPSGEHTLLVRFRETKLRFLADLVSLAGLLILGLGAIILKRLSRRKRGLILKRL